MSMINKNAAKKFNTFQKMNNVYRSGKIIGSVQIQSVWSRYLNAAITCSLSWSMHSIHRFTGHSPSFMKHLFTWSAIQFSKLYRFKFLSLALLVLTKNSRLISCMGFVVSFPSSIAYIWTTIQRPELGHVHLFPYSRCFVNLNRFLSCHLWLFVFVDIFNL